MKVLNEPLVGITDPAEQQVLILLAELSKKGREWNTGKTLALELHDLEQGLGALEGRIAILRGELSIADMDLKNIWKKPTIVGSFALAFLAAAAAVKFVPALIVTVSSAAFGVIKLTKERAKVAARKVEIERKRAEVADLLKSSTDRIAAIKLQRGTFDYKFPNLTLGHVAFPFREREILGRRCLIDQSGMNRLVTFKTVNLDAIGSELAPLVDAANKIAQVPVLLSPRSSDQEQEPLDRLYGEEDDFKSITADFTRVIGKVKDVTISLPLVPRASVVAKKLEAGKFVTGVLPESVLLVSNPTQQEASISQFVEQVNKVGQAGQTILIAFNKTYEALSHVGQLYASARSESLNHLHKELFDVLNRGSWCSKRFFCPRSIQSPTYIYDLLGFNAEDAHQLPLGDILTRLRSDQVISDRLSAKPELVENLRVAYDAVQDFEPANNFQANGGDPRPIYLEDQYAESLTQFRLSLTESIFGSTTPILNFSEDSRLYYDPETDQWTSNLTPHVYETGQVQKYGQILKVQNDLLFPMWEHLWVEKADFRKSEMFRTNDSLIRMSEKESEKIIEVGNQFRSDMRTVREHIYLLESERTSKRDELKTFGSSMGSLELLSAQQRQMLERQLNVSESDSDKPLLKEAEERESWLSMEPQNQAVRRGTVQDPLAVVKLPAILLAYSGETKSRLTTPIGGSLNG